MYYLQLNVECIIPFKLVFDWFNLKRDRYYPPTNSPVHINEKIVGLVIYVLLFVYVLFWLRVREDSQVLSSQFVAYNTDLCISLLCI